MAAVIDLDDFKVINDTHGHGCGDAALQWVARRLLDCVRSEDTVGRLGGDEFAVVAEVADRDFDRLLRKLCRVRRWLRANPERERGRRHRQRSRRRRDVCCSAPTRRCMRTSCIASDRSIQATPEQTFVGLDIWCPLGDAH